MKKEFLRYRSFRVSYDDGNLPYVSYKDNSKPVTVTVTDCFSRDIVSRFETTPKNLYNELIERGYISHGQS